MEILDYLAIGALGGVVSVAAIFALAVYFNGDCVGGFDHDEN